MSLQSQEERPHHLIAIKLGVIGWCAYIALFGYHLPVRNVMPRHQSAREQDASKAKLISEFLRATRHGQRLGPHI